MSDLTKAVVENWISTLATGEFHYKAVLDGKVDKDSYGKLRRIMYELVHDDEPIVEPIGRRDGYYRPIQDRPSPIDWQGADAKEDFPVQLPFDLRKWVWIDPDTIIIVGGAKSSGKTGYLYRTVAMNMKTMPVVLLSNMEGGRNQMLRRFNAMDIEIPTPAPFQVYHVTENFHDFIKEAHTLYVIDYIDAPEGTDFYLIGAAIRKVRNKLQNSVAVIGLQKPSTRDIAFGGEQTLKDAALYIALNNKSLKIVDAKVSANPKIHPKNMQWTFLYGGEGTNFLNIQQSGDIPEEEQGEVKF